MNRQLQLSVLCTVLCMWSAVTVPLHAQQNPAGLAQPNTAKTPDILVPVKPGEVKFTGGILAARNNANETNRMLKVDENELLDGFEQRLKPHQDWAGEHVGKWLHAATLTWADTKDSALRAKLDRVAARLIKTQEADGYLGTYAPSHRWTSWDVWVHKYDLIGLLTYYQFTGSKPALETCRKVGDLLVTTFGTGPGQRDINRAGEHMGMAADSVLEPIGLLYRATADPRYLEFARYIVSNYNAPGGPAILASLEKWHSVKRVANAKAYEMTSNFNGLLELYRITGDDKLLQDMQIAWDDIAANRLYLTGSASSYEVFQDDNQFPDGQKSNICETCVTVTWEQMNLQLLRLTGQGKYADQVERSVYNHLFAAQNPAGTDWVYYTPMEGRKQYDSYTTCCHSSGPRGVALLPDFAYMVVGQGLVVNWYNDSTVTTNIPGVGDVTIVQTTNYPLDGVIKLTITPPENGVKFSLGLRIPTFASNDPGFIITVNGKNPTRERTSGAGYYYFSRRWRRGDTVTLRLPVQPKLVMGTHGDEGRAAIIRGPLVLALDAELNPGIGPLKRIALASDDISKLDFQPAPEKSHNGEPVFSVKATVGTDPKPVKVYLSTFANAGEDGKSQYSVWIARPGHAAAVTGSGSAFSGAPATYSRAGNRDEEINDDDPDTFRVTFNGRKQAVDWFAVSRDDPVTINRVVYIHGKCFHDGGWFDTSSGKPRIEARTAAGGPWIPLGTLMNYPSTTATDSANLKDGQRFEIHFDPIKVYAIRIVGTPASGDNPDQNFISCAELQAFKTSL